MRRVVDVVAPTENVSPPRNVLYLLFDDLRADALPARHAPHLSRLAQEGTTFSLAFSQVAFCVPSRASFLTGLRPETTRSIHVRAT